MKWNVNYTFITWEWHSHFHIDFNPLLQHLGRCWPLYVEFSSRIMKVVVIAPSHLNSQSQWHSTLTSRSQCVWLTEEGRVLRQGKAFGHIYFSPVSLLTKLASSILCCQRGPEVGAPVSLSQESLCTRGPQGQAPDAPLVTVVKPALYTVGRCGGSCLVCLLPHSQWDSDSVLPLLLSTPRLLAILYQS